MNIVLLFPCPRKYISVPSMNILPLGLISMAAVLQKQGHDVTVIHMARYTPKDTERLIESLEPDIIGLSVFTFNRVRAFNFADRLKKFFGKLEDQNDGKSPFIIVGGPHVSSLALEVLRRNPSIDGVVTGEGETILPEIVSALETSSVPSKIPGFLSASEALYIIDGKENFTHHLREEQKRIEFLDELPTVNEHDISLLGVEKLFQKRHYLTSRGCSANCTFCSAPSLWGKKVVSHTVERVIKDVKALRDDYGITHVSFRDDTFTADKKWTLDFCSKMAGLNILWDCQSRVSAIDDELALSMRKAGCIHVQLGVESGSDSILNYLRKPFNIERAEKALASFKKTGMAISIYLICGVPDETRNDLAKTAELMRKYRPANLSVSRLAVYPGTDLAASFKDSVWFDKEDESLYLRDDRGALNNERFLEDLRDELSASEPYNYDELVKASEFTDDSPVAALALGQFLEREEEFEKAALVYRALLKKSPDYLWALLSLGSLYLDDGYIDESMPYLEKAHDLVPKWPYATNRLGWAYKLSGQDTDNSELELKGDELIERSILAEPFADIPEPPWFIETD